MSGGLFFFFNKGKLWNIEAGKHKHTFGLETGVIR